MPPHFRDTAHQGERVATPPVNAASLEERRARGVLWAVAGIFFLISLVGVDGPFLSTHNERQNQTYDTARQVFRLGWPAVITPRASFSLQGYEELPFTVTEQEFPFYGVLGWPWQRIFGHERAVVRLLATAFSLLSIPLLYRIIRIWLPPSDAAAGTVLWTTAPLLLQFGQVPMPDTLCTTGMLGSFWFATRGRVGGSSACFVFATLAKSNVLVFGLPILCAAVARQEVSTFKSLAGLTVRWGAAPLCSLLTWMALAQHFSPTSPWTLWQIFAQRGDAHMLLNPGFYCFIVGCLVIGGIGLMGLLMFFAGWGSFATRVDWRIKWALIVSTLVYFAVVVQKISEPQYFLPPLAWVSVACAFGADPLLAWMRETLMRRFLIGGAILAHVAVVVLATCELKGSRVPNFREIQEVAALLPHQARVIVSSPYYGGGAAVWLDRNVVVEHGVGELSGQWQRLQKLGFTHVALLAEEHRYEARSAAKSALRALHRLGGIWRRGPAEDKSSGSELDPAVRAYCDRMFSKVFEGKNAALYALPVMTSSPINR